MYERHENEQYFFDEPTISALADFVGETATAPCFLCAPLVGARVVEAGRAARILDVDERFAGVAGYRRYDLYRPERLDESFDLIVCDPPFFNASLSDLFRAIRLLAGFDFTKPLLLCYLRRRAAAITGTFAPFGVSRTGLVAEYRTVDASERNVIEFFSNLPPARVDRLATLLEAARG